MSKSTEAVLTRYFKSGNFNRVQIEARLMKRDLKELHELYKKHCGKTHRLIPSKMSIDDVVKRDKHNTIKKNIVKDLVMCLVSTHFRQASRMSLLRAIIDNVPDTDAQRIIMSFAKEGAVKKTKRKSKRKSKRKQPKRKSKRKKSKRKKSKRKKSKRPYTIL
jgi:hypothetical protein